MQANNYVDIHVCSIVNNNIHKCVNFNSKCKSVYDYKKKLMPQKKKKKSMHITSVSLIAKILFSYQCEILLLYLLNKVLKNS